MGVGTETKNGSRKREERDREARKKVSARKDERTGGG